MESLKLDDIKKMTKEQFEAYDVSKFDERKLRSFVHCFMRLHEDVETLDLSKWDTSKITNMNGLFERCMKLKEVKGLNTENVKNKRNIFVMCPRLNKQ